MMKRIAIVMLLACAVACTAQHVSFGIGLDGRISFSVVAAPPLAIGCRTIYTSTYNGVTYYSERPMFGVTYTLSQMGWSQFVATYPFAYCIDGGLWIATSMLPYRYFTPPPPAPVVVHPAPPVIVAPRVVVPVVPRHHHHAPPRPMPPPPHHEPRMAPPPPHHAPRH